MNTLSFKIDGMGCGSCVQKVRSALKSLPGVTVGEVKVGSATVTVNNPTASAQNVADALARVGFNASPVEQSASEQPNTKPSGHGCH